MECHESLTLDLKTPKCIMIYIAMYYVVLEGYTKLIDFWLTSTSELYHHCGTSWFSGARSAFNANKHDYMARLFDANGTSVIEIAK